MSAATVASPSEKRTDSWVLPLPASVAYRLAGSDAHGTAQRTGTMWSYHTPLFERLPHGLLVQGGSPNDLPPCVRAAGQRPDHRGCLDGTATIVLRDCNGTR